MAIARVQSASGLDTTFASSVGATFVSPNSAGNCIMLAWEGDAATAINKANTPTDTGGNTYTRLLSTFLSGVFDLEIWVALNVAAKTGNVVTVTDTLGGADGIVIIEEFSGVATAAAVDVTGVGTTGTSTALDSGPLTTLNANDLLWGAGAIAAGANDASLGAGYSNLTQNHTTFSNLATESQIVAATGTSHGLMTSSASLSWAMGLVALKAAAAGVTNHPGFFRLMR